MTFRRCGKPDLEDLRTYYVLSGRELIAVIQAVIFTLREKQK